GGAGGAGSAAGGQGTAVAGGTGTAIPALASPQEFTPSKDLRTIHFSFDKSDIRPQDARILDDNAKWLKGSPATKILIEGHCDDRGTIEYNLALGERRAKATRDYLVTAGIDASRITTVSYGKERPVCTGQTEECWAQNRRAAFLVKQ